MHKSDACHAQEASVKQSVFRACLVLLVPLVLNLASDFAEFLNLYGALVANVINILLPCKMYTDTLLTSIDSKTSLAILVLCVWTGLMSAISTLDLIYY